MGKYKVSIIVPIYNIEKYIKKCIDSILKQTIIDKIELILVNDGSTDNSLKIIDEYEKNYKNIKVISQENAGVSSARNIGIENATGDYLLFVDGDDFISENYVENLLKATENGFYDLIVADYWIYYSENNLKKYRNSRNKKEWNNTDAIKELLSGGLIGNNLFDKLFKRECIKEIRFSKDIKIGEDLLFIYQYLKNTKKIKGIFLPGYFYVKRDGSAMNSKFSEKQFDIIKVCDIIGKDITEKEELFPVFDAFSIYCKYKLLERAYKSGYYELYIEQINVIKYDIKKYKISSGYKYLSKRRFYGLVLIKFFPSLYLLICRIKKI